MRFATPALVIITFLAIATIQPLQADDRMVYAPSARVNYVVFPGLPACSKGFVQNGDPAKGASVIFAKATAGCLIPWHWHTPTEQLMMVAGRGKVEMRDGAPITLLAGDYASLPSKHVHQFTCPTACKFFVVSNVAFDIHYVDARGNEISQDEALKASQAGRRRRAHSSR